MLEPLSGSVDFGHLSAVLTGTSLRSDIGVSHLSLLERAESSPCQKHLPTHPNFHHCLCSGTFTQGPPVFDPQPKDTGFPQKAAHVSFTAFQEFHMMDVFIKTYQQGQETITEP